MLNQNNDAIKLLTGKTFISTRPAGKSKELSSLLEARGAILLEMPTIEIYPIELSAYKKEMITHIDQFDWIIFTSANGVNHFFNHFKKLTGSYALPLKTKIAVIGEKTGDKLSDYGYKAHYTNKGSTSNDFSVELNELFREEKPKVLLLLGNLARETIEHDLKNIADVSRINIYTTEMPASIPTETLKRIVEDKYDMVIFTSPSSFHNFCHLVEGKINMAKLRAASIGTITTEALIAINVKPLVMAETMNSEGIIMAIDEYYKKRQK